MTLPSKNSTKISDDLSPIIVEVANSIEKVGRYEIMAGDKFTFKPGLDRRLRKALQRWLSDKYQRFYSGEF